MEENATKRSCADVHVHLQDKRFGETWEDVERYLERAREQGVVKLVCDGTSPADWKRTAEIARRFENVLPSFGVHPWNVGKISGDWLGVLKGLLDGFDAKDGETRAGLGEVGLDFAVRDCDESAKKAQEDALRAQLELANERAIPTTLHSARANDRLLKIMAEYPKIPVWLLHGWTATQEEVDRALELGAFFSFSRRSVDENARRARATILAVPRDKILLESDGPILLPPDGYAGNARVVLVQARDADGFILDEPSSLWKTARSIGAIRGVNFDDFARQLSVNERRFFQNWLKIKA